MTNKSVSTFWKGAALSNYERACLRTFVTGGFDVAVYSFDRMDGLPHGVRCVDAREVDDGRDLESFIYDGKPNLQHYSDLFRLKLLAVRDTIWIDSDVVFLHSADLPQQGLILGKEDRSVVCNAILRIPSSDRALPGMIAAVEGLRGRELAWGQTGHVLLMDYLVAEGRTSEALGAEVLYPVHWTEFWKPFLPEFAEECRYLCGRASTLHLWNNLVVRMGLWKLGGPPEGSFLYEAFERGGALGQFEHFYPPEVMYRLVENWVARDGGDLGVKRVLRLLKSSVRNTARRAFVKNPTPFLHDRKSLSPLASER